MQRTPAILAVVFASLGLSAGTAGAARTTHSANAGKASPREIKIGQGVDPAAMPGAVAFGVTPSYTPESVSFILKESHKAALEADVERGITHFLSVKQFADYYGQPISKITELETYLAQFGISSNVYRNHVDLSATGTAGEFDAALATIQDNYSVPAQRSVSGAIAVRAQTVHATVGSPELPSSVGSFVLAVLGLSNYSSAITGLAHADHSLTVPREISSSSCVELSGLPNACHTPQDFARIYGLDPLYKYGAIGRGETLAIVTLASADQGAAQTFWRTVVDLRNTRRTIRYVNIDGGAGPPSNNAGTGETDLDIQQSGGVAPGANIIVYQAPNTDPGFIDGFFTAASENIANSVSSSWGESETIVDAAVAAGEETATYQAAFDEAFLELAAQGQSTFVSAGDDGAYDASDDLGSTNLSVDTPGSSPYVTDAGATTLPWSGQLVGPTDVSANVTVPKERAWGWDYLWPAIAATTPDTTLAEAAETDVAGSGGGFSTVEPEPSYQVGVRGTGSFTAIPYLTPTTPGDPLSFGLTEPTAWNFNPSPGLITGTGSGRAVPDLATDGDPESGYLLYSPAFAQAQEPVLEAGWGGTSFVAPELNGSTAVIDSALGHRIGLWNPMMYRAATSASSPFIPLDGSGAGNDNIYFTGTPGTLFNEATGLGVPNLGALATDFKHIFSASSPWPPAGH
jgi:subtilase family serine protease